MRDFEDVNLGDFVWDVAYGWGRVSDITFSKITTPISSYGRTMTVTEVNRFVVTFARNGYEVLNDYSVYGRRIKRTNQIMNRTLFWDEINFFPPRKPDGLVIDTKLIVWNSNSLRVERYFAGYSYDRKVMVFHDGATSWSANGKIPHEVYEFYEVVDEE